MDLGREKIDHVNAPNKMEYTEQLRLHAKK